MLLLLVRSRVDLAGAGVRFDKYRFAGTESIKDWVTVASGSECRMEVQLQWTRGLRARFCYARQSALASLLMLRSFARLGQ